MKKAGTVNIAHVFSAKYLQHFPYVLIIIGCIWKRYTEKADAAIKLITGLKLIFLFLKNKNRKTDCIITTGLR